MNAIPVASLRRGTVIVLALCLLCACAGPVQKPGPDESTPTRPQVQVSIGDLPPGFRVGAEAAVREALPGVDLRFDPNGTAGAPVRLALELDYHNLTETEFETVWRMTTFFLLTMYPSTCVHRRYDLTATVTGPDGVARAYLASDTTVAWIWLLQAPHCEDVPSQDEIAAVSRRLLADVLHDMGADRALEQAASGVTIPPSPLVRIVANRAGPIVEQVARVERPFARWVLAGEADAGTAVADVVMDLHFDVNQGSFSLARGFLAIGTGGLSTLAGGICTATHVSLQATVSSQAAPRTLSYSFSDAVATHVGDNSGNCESIDERSRPEVFAALLRRLFAAVQRDNMLQAVAPGAAGVPSVPLVRIEVGRAESLVREITTEVAPFPRYVFGARPDGQHDDYVLGITLETSGGDARKLGTLGQIGSGALFGLTGIMTMCEPTTFTLRARLTDRAGRELRSYDVARAFRHTNDMSVGCRDDESSNPGAVRSLVRELYRRMQRDGSLRMLLDSPAP